MVDTISSSGIWLRPHLTETERSALEAICARDQVRMSVFARDAVAYLLLHVDCDVIVRATEKSNEVGRELNETARQLNRTVRRFGRALRMKDEERSQLIEALEVAASLSNNAARLSRDLSHPDREMVYVHVQTKFGAANGARPKRVGFRVMGDMAQAIKENVSGSRGSVSLYARSAIILAIARARLGDNREYTVATDRAIQSLIISRRRWQTNRTQIEDAAEILSRILTSSRYIDDQTRLAGLKCLRSVKSYVRETCESLESLFQDVASKLVEV